MQYSEDEKKIINAIAQSIKTESYRKTEEDYLFRLEWSQILADPVEQYERLLSALESLRKHNFDNSTKSSTILQGYIMRAKINKQERIVDLLVSEMLVAQLLASYHDDDQSTTRHKKQQPTLSIHELVERVGVLSN